MWQEHAVEYVKDRWGALGEVEGLQKKNTTTSLVIVNIKIFKFNENR